MYEVIINGHMVSLSRSEYWDLVYATTTKEEQKEIEKHFWMVDEPTTRDLPHEFS